MIVLTGIDLASIREVNKLAAGPGSFDDVWTLDERRAHEGYPERRAGQWAAKEAVMKVLGNGIGRIDPRDIEIVTAEGSRPQVRLHGEAANLGRSLRITSLSISITHEHGAAAAVAVALVEEERSDGEF
jgi:phosphopantetheine--protein transferase-like protein